MGGTQSVLPQYTELGVFKQSVPFYMYNDAVMRMDSMSNCSGWLQVQDSGGDLALIEILHQHPWRVYDPHEAKVFIIPIPVASSMLYGDRECGETHFHRMTSAFRRLYAHPVYQTYNASHYLHCQHWKCFLAWRWPAPDMFPPQLFNEGNLSNIMMGRYERYLTTQSDCEKFNATFHICPPESDIKNLKSQYPLTGLYQLRWELSRCAIAVPYLPPADLPQLKPSFAEWRARKNTVFCHTASHHYAWLATKLRHAPVNGSFSSLPGVNVGFGLSRKDWLSEIAQSKFCLVLRGDTPTSHSLYNAIKVGCIPVIISGTFPMVGQPFSSQIPWSLLTVTLPEDVFLADPVAIARFLWQLPDKHLRTLHANLLDTAQSALLYERNSTLADRVLRQLDIECLI